VAKKQHSGAPAEQGSGGQKARGKRGIGTSAKVIIGVVAAILIFGFGASVGAGDVSFGVRRHAANANLPARLDYSSVNAEYSLLRQKYDGKLTSQQLLNGMKKGMAKATGDPYTVYFTPKEAKHFHSELNNSFTGIGAQLGKDKQGRVQVIAPLKGFPAQKAGLKAQDRITSINGKSTSGMSVAEAAKRIRGKAGTTVKLGLARVAEHGGARKLTIAITRARIHLPSVTAKILRMTSVS
jgi:carboxyl-terminal processing protease